MGSARKSCPAVCQRKEPVIDIAFSELMGCCEQYLLPALARKQILLAASHQFAEGDVYHWFFTLTDGRTAFSCRSHASDNPIWLSWAIAEYVRSTGDSTILDEVTSYVVSQFPFA